MYLYIYQGVVMEHTGTSATASAAKQNILDELVALISQLFNIDKHALADETKGSLSNEIGLDSIDLINLVVGIEDHWNIVIPDQMLYSLDTIDKLAEHITKTLADAERLAD